MMTMTTMRVCILTIRKDVELEVAAGMMTQMWLNGEMRQARERLRNNRNGIHFIGISDESTERERGKTTTWKPP